MLAKSLQKYSIWHPSYVSGSPGFPTFWRSEATLWLFVTAPFMKMMHFWPAYWSPDQTESFLTLKMFFACNLTIYTFEPIALATRLVLILMLLIILILTIFIMNWSPAGYPTPLQSWFKDALACEDAFHLGAALVFCDCSSMVVMVIMVAIDMVVVGDRWPWWTWWSWWSG